MKFTATTSSLLLASMALSPSLVSAAPTGMEAPTSPNPSGSPSIRQFPPSPRFAKDEDSVGSSPKMNRAPALRTGPGSPRRSIPARMLKVNKRDGAAPASPLDGLIDPLTGILGPVLSPVAAPIKSIAGPLLDPLVGALPVVGGPLESAGHGLGIMGVGAPGQAPNDSRAQSLLASGNNPLGSMSPQTADPQQILNELPGLDGLSGLLGSLPVPGLPLSGSGPVDGLQGLAGSLPSQVLGPAEGLLPSQILGPAEGLLPSIPGVGSLPLGLAGGVIGSLPSPFSGPVGSLLPPSQADAPHYASTPGVPINPAGLSGTQGGYLPYPATVPQAPAGVASQIRIIGETAGGLLVEINGVPKLLPFHTAAPVRQVPNLTGPGSAFSAESVPVSASSPAPSGGATPLSPHVTPPSPDATPSAPVSSPSPPAGSSSLSVTAPSPEVTPLSPPTPGASRPSNAPTASSASPAPVV